jgi:hypothetical protein
VLSSAGSGSEQENDNLRIPRKTGRNENLTKKKEEEQRNFTDTTLRIENNEIDS